MDAPSYAKAPGGRRFGLRERLLLGLLLGALGTVMVAVVGWISFQRVVDSQQDIIRHTLPTADALHDAVRGNARLAAQAPRLARADSMAELEQLRALVNQDLPLIRDRLAALDSPQVEPELRARLQATGDTLSLRLATMGETVAARLRLRDTRAQAGHALREQIAALKGLAQTQADNAMALLVSTLTTLLQTETWGLSPTVVDRRATGDRLLDRDLDSLERMHELSLTAHGLGALVDRLDELDTLARVEAARSDFDAQLSLLARRVDDIAAPGGRVQGSALHHALATALAPGGAFALRATELELRVRSDALQAEVGTLTTELDALAGELIHRGGRILAAAGLAAERSATTGVIAFGVIGAALLIITALVSIQILRRHTLGRLLALEKATLALAAGKRDVSIDTSGDDELSSLSFALERFRNDAIERDRLAEALRLQREELEHQVVVRTLELSDSNIALAHETAEHAAARIEAEKADRAKTAFLGTVSHELRTPMAGILGLLELLEDTSTLPAQQQYVAQIRAAATLLLELLEDMLDFARIEAGGVQVERSAFSLRETVNNVFAVQGTRAATRGLALVADIATEVSDSLFGDRRKLSQILLNLIGNAIKFSDEGAVTVVIKPGQQPGKLCFAVKDHGIGIAPARQREIFEPFVQVRDSDRHHAGTGLGLAVCKRLVEAMGGEIGVRSALGQGTTVSFELEFEQGQPPALPSADERAKRLISSHTILVVEDDDVNRLVIERFLSTLGQHAVCAGNIQSALDTMAEQDVELALVDMNLPDGDGRELLTRLRGLPHGGQIPAVLMSAHVPASEVQFLLDSGFSAFLSKPFTRAQLEALLVRELESDKPAATEARHGPDAARPSGDQPLLNGEPDAAEWVNARFLQAEQEALGEAVLAQIASVFLAQGQSLVADLRAAAQAREPGECKKHAHKLRGAASNVGLARLAQVAGALEDDILAGLPGESLPQRAQVLEQAYLRSASELERAIGRQADIQP
ncbi:MAG TPA: ATP-binding protein [Thauera sp.]|nr:ATP-binding protein [Thauera sp.]